MTRARPSRAVLERGFYGRPCLEVARALVGKHLVRRREGRLLVGRIVETEAYCGLDDRASHASRGRTPRTAIMFGPPGYAYVYLVYGMHSCLNVVCDRDGFPAAVLLRAVEPVLGFDGGAEGPGRLCRALGVDRRDNGADLVGGDLWIEDRGGPVPRIACTPRIGVDYAGECAGRPWRFVDADSRHLSRPLARGA